MKLYTKKLLAYGLSALTLSSMPLYASSTTTTLSASQEKSVLTMEEAIAAALSHNNDLALNSKQDKVYEEQLKYSSDLSTLAYQSLYTSKQQNAQNKEFLKDKISYDISDRYYTIVLAEKELANLDLDIEMKQRELDSLAVKQRLGLATQLQYDAAELELTTLNTSKQTKLEALESNKTNFKILTGKDLNTYALEADFVLDKLDVANNAEGFIKSKVGTYLKYSKELAQIQINHIADNYLTSAPTVAQHEQNKYTAQQTAAKIEDSEDSLIQGLNTMYSSLLNLEEQIIALQPKVALLEKQIETAKVQYRVGLMTKIDYDKTVSSLKDTDYALNQLIYNYNALKQQIEKPWVMKTA